MPGRRNDPAGAPATQPMPATVPIFPLPGALLLPRGQMPLNIFEPRYLAMVEAALGSGRMIGMVQPRLTDDGEPEGGAKPPLAEIGCLGRITNFSETEDGRYLITLTGVTRFRVVEEMDTTTRYRQARIDASGFENDTVPRAGEDAVDRSRLLKTFRDYLDANELQADWDSVNQASNESLVNALAMLSPYGPREKQALLEAEDLAGRAELLIALTELSMVEDGTGEETTLQ